MGPRVAIVYYSMYGRTKVLADAEKRGVEAAGGTTDIFQIAEILPNEVLAKFGAPPPDSSVPIATPATLESYDAFLFGVPTHFGNWPLQWEVFWDAATTQWRAGSYWGKLVGAFVSCNSIGAGQETTIVNMLPTFAHHGLIYVPLGCINDDILGSCTKVSGGSPWGAGTFAGMTNDRSPTTWELEIAERQGHHFCIASSGWNQRDLGGLKGLPAPAMASELGS